MTDERNQLIKECAELRATAARKGGKAFKGMTVSEQAAVLGEQVELKVHVDELGDELTSAKAVAAKAEWVRLLSTVYCRARYRVECASSVCWSDNCVCIDLPCSSYARWPCRSWSTAVCTPTHELRLF
jgi:hypothetical protein